MADPKFCRDCKHAQRVAIGTLPRDVLGLDVTHDGVCLHEDAIAVDLITGFESHYYMKIMRGIVDPPKPISPTCGPEGAWWEAREE